MSNSRKKNENEEKSNFKLMQNVDDYLRKSIETEMIPGAVILIVKDKKVQLYKKYGYSQIIPSSVQMEKDSIFDIASLSKVVATWPAIMLLIDRGIIKLNHKLYHFYGNNIDSTLRNVTIFQLLTHTSGLSEGTFLKQFGDNKEKVMKGLLNDGLKYRPGKQVIYSNRGFIILGDIIEKISGISLDTFMKENIWEPLNMKDTVYNPNQKLLDRIVSTEYLPTTNLVKRGIVHDENAELLGGIAGHAGAFSTVSDIGKYCAMILDSFNGEGENVITRNLVIESFTNYTKKLNDNRGLGWVIFNESENSKVVGHYGFTGTTIWIDIKKNMYTVLLTNRVHPSRENKSIQSIRAYIRETLLDVS